MYKYSLVSIVAYNRRQGVHLLSHLVPAVVLNIDVVQHSVNSLHFFICALPLGMGAYVARVVMG
jgi:hypothetical protein